MDTELQKMDYVITSDAIILDKCRGWINIVREIIKDEKGDYPFIDFETE